MGKKLNKVYDALLEGATEGRRDQQLYDFVKEQCPKTSSKRIVKASLFALSDPDVRDRKVLEAIYALAITYRLSALGVEEDAHKNDDDDSHAPKVSDKLKKKLEGSVSKLSAVETAEIPPASWPLAV